MVTPTPDASPDRGAASARISIDYSWSELSARLAGLTDDEFRWEPVAAGLALRRGDDGTWVADAVDHDVTPPPFATIGWRLWHLVDCFDSYRIRAYEEGDDDVDHRFVATASEAIDRLGGSIGSFLAAFDGLGDRVGDPLGPAFGPFAERNHVDLLLHASRELVHHGAEIALLRDLWQHGLR